MKITKSKNMKKNFELDLTRMSENEICEEFDLNEI